MTPTKIKALTEYHKDLTPRKLKNLSVREEAKEQAERNQKPVKKITISIEWRKSLMWGNNPHATASVEFADGGFERQAGFTCSGCGYDKESTVIAQIFNQFLKYRLWAMEGAVPPEAAPGGTKPPYGVLLTFDHSPYFEGGIGTSCYFKISEFIGGVFERVASGETFDVYSYTEKEV